MPYLEPTTTRRASIITPQNRHRSAAELHDKAAKHHRQAALLHDAGDERQAETHANIANRHARSALVTSEAAQSAVSSAHFFVT